MGATIPPSFQDPTVAVFANTHKLSAKKCLLRLKSQLKIEPPKFSRAFPQPQGQLNILSLFHSVTKSFIPDLVGKGLFKQYLYYSLKINLSLEKKYNSIFIAKHQRAAAWRSLPQSEKPRLGFNLIPICSNAKVIFLWGEWGHSSQKGITVSNSYDQETQDKCNERFQKCELK